MNNNELVSIIIPCYDQAQYLKDAVDSAIDQTYSKIEIIIVNDGSPDNTQKIAEELQNKYPKKIQIISQENCGLYAARNSGIKNASGQYIVSLDADDMLHKRMVEKCINTINEYDADIVYTGYQGFGISNRVNMWKPFEQTTPLYETPCGALAFIKKKVWEITGGYKQNMNDGYEDWEFWINAFKHNFKFQHIPEKLYYYRIKKESMFINAYIKDNYLKSKIVMNHPELYTIHRVKNAIETIRETEDLADLYFYVPKNAPITNTIVIQFISHYLFTNTISNKDHFIIDDQNIVLYALDDLKNIEEIKKIIKQNNSKHLFFYSSIRYQMDELKKCNFAWKNGLMVEAEGTLFPYISKEMRENKKLQLFAHQRLEKYHEYIHNKLSNLQKKYTGDMNNANRKSSDLKHKLELVYASASYKLGYILLHEKKSLLNPKLLLKRIGTINKMRNKIESNEPVRLIDNKSTSTISTPIHVNSRNNEVIHNSFVYNDCITKLLLHNSSEIELSTSEYEKCLSYYKTLSEKKSEFATTSNVNPLPHDWPKDLTLSPLPESTNDFKWKRVHLQDTESSNHHKTIGLSIIVPTFNRSKILAVTLACLVNQKTDYPFEVIVADDGSKEDLTLITRKFEDKLNIKMVRQGDDGFQVAAVRNLGLNIAKYDYVSFLDCDMAPNIFWVQSYMELLIKDDDVAFIGPRKYVDTHNIDPNHIMDKPELISSLPEVITNNDVAGKRQGNISIDWRLKHFKKSNNLRLCNSPFRYFSGGNIAFAKKWLDIAGYFDEEFTHWGGEDVEFGYRLYREGCFFRAVEEGLAYHQEPPEKRNETDRAAGNAITKKIFEQKVPYFYRKLQNIESAVIKKVPLVSIYIPAYNCENSIVRCIESALNQTVTDLEVCICDDGSTDKTLEILKNKYANHPRVKYMTQKNGGIGKASNSAVKITRGFYIGQLDSDDYLEPDAVELCLKEFFKDKQLACVYTTNRNVKPDGILIENGYNWPKYSREKLTTTMICHHFRMFTIRAWNLTTGFDEEISNAVDYDMYLKLSNLGPFKHINRISYNRVLHGKNTSITKLGLQKKNHFIVVSNHLHRNKIYHKKYLQENDKDSCRKYKFITNKELN